MWSSELDFVDDESFLSERWNDGALEKEITQASSFLNAVKMHHRRTTQVLFRAEFVLLCPRDVKIDDSKRQKKHFFFDSSDVAFHPSFQKSFSGTTWTHREKAWTREIDHRPTEMLNGSFFLSFGKTKKKLLPPPHVQHTHKHTCPVSLKCRPALPASLSLTLSLSFSLSLSLSFPRPNPYPPWHTQSLIETFHIKNNCNDFFFQRVGNVWPNCD
jgi:hypothetical protein